MDYKELIKQKAKEYLGLSDTIESYYGLNKQEVVMTAFADGAEAMREIANTWRPIETAPKDGTQILVYSKQDGVVWVSWDTEEIYYPNCKPEKCWCVPGSHQDEQGGCYRIDDATHWMPVPEAPTE